MATIDQTVLERLKKIRESKTLKLKKGLPNMRSSFFGYDKKEHPLKLRYYQVQGVMHLLVMRRFVLGDDCGLGKTIQAITALCCLWDQDPNTKVVVATIKSSVPEWVKEFAKFTMGIRVIEVPTPTGLAPTKRHPVKDDEVRAKPKETPEHLAARRLALKEERKFFDRLCNHTPTEERNLWRSQIYPDLCRLWRRAAKKKDAEAQDFAVSFARTLVGAIPVTEEQKLGLGEVFRKYRLMKVSPQERRKKYYDQFKDAEGPTVLVLNYEKAVADYEYLQDLEDFVLITDEATAYKSTNTNIHRVFRVLAQKSSRVWALTATLIKNNLMEGFGIFRVLVPELFPTKTHFHANYCVVRMQPAGNGRMVPVVVAHSKKHIQGFCDAIRPYYLGRPKHEVAKELPGIITKVVEVGLTKDQENLYTEALTGLLVVKDEEKEVTALTKICYCQEIVNHPELIGRKGRSLKLEKLIEILSEGDLAKEKVVVFTRFSKMVDIGVRVLESKGIPCVRVTGSENEGQRKASMEAFQDLESGVRVAWITLAGAQAINLQMGKAIIFYDTPFSAGDYLQSRGRIDRIGSPHDVLYSIHLVASETVDERIMEIHHKKMDLLEAVLGKRTKEFGASEVKVRSDNDISELFLALMADAKKRRGRGR